MSTNRNIRRILAFFIGICLLNPPPLPTENLKPELIAKSMRVVQAPGQLKVAKPKSVKTLTSLIKPTPMKWYAGKTMLTDRELSYLLYEVGFRGKEHRLAWIVAKGESTGRPKSLNSSGCYGLFQINMSGEMKSDRLKKYKLKSVRDLFNPVTNSKIAFMMSRKGTNWSAWTVNPYKRSSYNYPGIVTHQPKQKVR